jgi:hypothetical protein
MIVLARLIVTAGIAYWIGQAINGQYMELAHLLERIRP